MATTTTTPTTPATFWIRCGFILNCSVFIAQILIFVGLAWRGEFWRADFPMFYTGWSMVLAGDGAQLYDLSLQAEYQARIVPERDPPGLLPFNYPPHAAIPLCLLAYLPRDAAFWTWIAFQVVLVMVLLRLCLELSSEWTSEARLLLVVTILAFPALQGTFQLGQISLLILVSLTGFTIALAKNRTWIASLCLVLATLKPQLALIPILVVLFGRRWRILAQSALLGLSWAAMATLILGSSIWLDWLAVIGESVGQSGSLGIFPDRMYNLKCILVGLLGPRRVHIATQISLAILTLVILVVAWLWSTPWPRGAEFQQRLAFSFQLGFLANPHLNPADALVYVLPGLLYCLGERPLLLRPLMMAGLVACPIIYHIDCIYITNWEYNIRPFTVVMLILAGGLARGLNQSPSADSGMLGGSRVLLA